MRTRFYSLLAIILLMLSACGGPNTSMQPRNGTLSSQERTISATQGQNIPTAPSGSIMTQGNEGRSTLAQGKVAILLPLSGAQSEIGQSMLQSAQLALFNMNETAFELIPIDTQGTASGAAQAVQQAADQRAQLILGPLLAQEVAAAGQAAQRYNIPVIGFTTDWSRAGGNVFTLGILPFDQGERLAGYAAQSNLRRIAVITPQDAYANAVMSAFQNAARANNISIVQQVTIDSNGQNASTAAQTLAAQRGQFDAILMPFGNPAMSTVSSALASNGLGANQVRWLGTGLWEDQGILSNSMMSGALYAAPSPQGRTSFEQSYEAVYGQRPPRLASLSYDATALAIILLRQQGGVNRNTLLNPNGFAGVDGIFRFRSNGLAERGLAIHRIGNGRSDVVDQAPNSFLTNVGDLASR